MDVTQRNENAKQFILDKLDLASTLTESNFEQLDEYLLLKSTLNSLINVSAKGFRGIVATAITGKFLDPTYDPLNNFYGCNPRSIFEQGIFYAFENRIPCGKSDPLNVAKNINVLNDEWAKGKRPQSAAQAAVDYIRQIEESTDKTQEKIINFFFFKLLEYANSITSIKISLPENQEWSNQLFASKLSQFVLEYPESGTIPQLVISKLLNKVYVESTVIVEGGDESVFGTNTTSKKPADIWLEINNTAFNLFEITVKKVDSKRLDDCIQALNSLDMLNIPVHFICRLPTDISTLQGIENGILNYKGKVFNFVDICSFIHSLSSLLSATQITEILDELQSFVQQIDRSVKTKEGWKIIFS
jgi:hypothetical protein